MRGEAQPLGAAEHRLVLREHVGHGGVVRRGDRDPVEPVVGLERTLQIARALRRGERVVRGAHLVELGRGEAGHGGAHGDRVQRAHDGLRVADRRGVDRRHDGRAPRRRLYEPRAGQFEQRLAHGRAAHSEPRRQLGVAQLLAGRQ